MDELIKVATEATIGALTKAAVEPALTAGQKVWAWIKGKVLGADACTVIMVEADPTKSSAATKVAAILQDFLHRNPEAAKELRALLNAGDRSQVVTQTANVNGNNNKVEQVTGSGNTVSIG